MLTVRLDEAPEQRLTEMYRQLGRSKIDYAQFIPNGGYLCPLLLLLSRAVPA
jgi:hypothetical protein